MTFSPASILDTQTDTFAIAASMIMPANYFTGEEEISKLNSSYALYLH